MFSQRLRALPAWPYHSGHRHRDRKLFQVPRSWLGAGQDWHNSAEGYQANRERMDLYHGQKPFLFSLSGEMCNCGLPAEVLPQCLRYKIPGVFEPIWDGTMSNGSAAGEIKALKSSISRLDFCRAVITS